MKTILLSLAGLLCALNASAAMIRNDNNTTIRLGYGIDPDVERVYDSAPCVTFDPNDIVGEDQRDPNVKIPTSSKTFNVSKEIITSSLKVDEYTHTSVSASVQYMAVGGNFSMDEKNVFKLSSDQVAVGIKAEADYGRWYLNNVHLKPDAASRTTEEFYKRCGHEYVSGFKLGQGISVLLTTSALSVLNQHSLSVSGGVTLGASKVSAAVGESFEQSAMELLKYGRVQVKVTGYGGAGGLTGLSATLSNEDDIKKFTQQIGEIMDKMTASDATKSAYVTSEYPEMTSTYSPMLADVRHTTYVSLFSDFRRVLADISRIQAIKREGFAGQFTKYCNRVSSSTCKDYGDYLDHLSDLNQQALVAINAAAEKCVTGNSVSDCVSASVWDVNPTLSELAQPSVKLASLRQQLYQSLVDTTIRRK